MTEEEKNTKGLLEEMIVHNLVLYLMRDFGMDMTTAFQTVFNSEVYERLTDAETGLYIESPVYVYDYLIKEMRMGKVDSYSI